MQQQTTFDNDNALWQWSLKTYENPAVASALLALQDEGEDGRWLLYLLWCGREQLSAKILPQPPTHYLDWRNSMIMPIRRLRLTCDKELPLRQALLTAELTAEQQGMTILFANHAALNDGDKRQGLTESQGIDNDVASTAETPVERYAKTRSTDENSAKWQQLLQHFV